MSSTSDASAPTSTPFQNDGGGGNNGGGRIEITALLIALVALVISSLQLLLQYITSAAARAKCNKSAIGVWSKKNKNEWAVLQARFVVFYARPVISTQELIKSLKAQQSQRKEHMRILSNYKVTELTAISDTKDGISIKAPPELQLTRRGTEEGRFVNLSTLSRRERLAANAIQAAANRAYTPAPPTRASWCTLLTDLGIDLLELPAGGMIDADSIPASMDAPAMQVRMSDVIHFGLLLDMSIVDVDELKRYLIMTGRQCSINSQYHDGVGMVARYSGMAYGNQPDIRRASVVEAEMLYQTADGLLYIGDAMISMSRWGYNSVYQVIKDVLKGANGSGWQEVHLGETMKQVEGDHQVSWNGKWSRPATPVTAFLMSLCGNMGVANSFPHSLLQEWTESRRSVACQSAWNWLDSPQGPGFVFAPNNIIQLIQDSKEDLIVMDSYKTVNNFGCQYGGIRSWLSTCLSEFTLRMAKCWRVDERQDAKRVPILPQLKLALAAGELGKSWGEEYNDKPDEGSGWKMNANTLLWLQITMLDTWIAHHVDVLVSETALPELPVPSPLAEAEKCARVAAQLLSQTTAWNPPRLSFLSHYLELVASGVTSRNGDTLGVSFMSTTAGFLPEQHRWTRMPTGETSLWMAVDAALTLRAVLMHARLVLMKDSSALRRLRNFDPMVLLA